MKRLLTFSAVALIALTAMANAQARPGVYGMIADFEGPTPIADVTPSGFMYTFTSQQSTINNITPDAYGAPVGLIVDAADAPSGFGVGHIQVTVNGADFPVAGFGFMFEQDATITFPDALDETEFGGKAPYDYSDLQEVRFFARGSGPWFFQLKSLAYVGLPAPGRYDEIDLTFSPRATWGEVVFRRAALIPGGWSSVAPTQEDILAQLVGVHFVAKESATTGTEAELFVDAVRFGSSTQPAGTVTPGGTGPISVKEVVAEVAEVSLSDATPNPFNPVTNISFNLVSAERVTLNVYDAAGNLVNTLYNGIGNAGVNTVTWNGTDANGSQVASGVYFYRLVTNSRTLTRSMILMK